MLLLINMNNTQQANVIIINMNKNMNNMNKTQQANHE